MQSLFDDLANPDTLMHYDANFKDYIEMNLADLRASSVANSNTIQLTKYDKALADRDFRLLCNLAKVPLADHWIMLRLNGYMEYNQYAASDEKEIYLIDYAFLGNLKRKFRESQNNT